VLQQQRNNVRNIKNAYVWEKRGGEEGGGEEGGRRGGRSSQKLESTSAARKKCVKMNEKRKINPGKEERGGEGRRGEERRGEEGGSPISRQNYRKIIEKLSKNRHKS
jgi:hypothetical protein